MINGLQSVARERARLERDRIVTESMIQDGIVADLILSLDNSLYMESASEDKQIEALLDQIPETTDGEAEDEIERIMAADEEGLDIDSVLGVQDAVM